MICRVFGVLLASAAVFATVTFSHSTKATADEAPLVDPLANERVFQNTKDSTIALLGALRGAPQTDTVTEAILRVESHLMAADSFHGSGALQTACRQAELAYSTVSRALAAVKHAPAPDVGLKTASASEELDNDRVRVKLARDIETAEALADAYDRASSEQGGIPGPFANALRKHIDEVKHTAGRGQLSVARRLLDDVYAGLQARVVTLKDGQTVIKTLSFDNPAEEFHYEQDRYKSHIMVLQMVLMDRSVSIPTRVGIESLLNDASALSSSAERHFSRGDQEQAINTLSEATVLVIKAIRKTGLFIPG